MTKLLPAAPSLPVAVGKRFTTVDGLNIRSAASSSSTSVAKVDKGIVLLITGVVKDGYTQVIYSGATRWAASMYLSTTRPGTTTAVGAVGSLGSATLDRTNANAKGIVLALREKFPQIKTIYGWRMYSAYSSDHPNGRALDIMIPSYSTASGKALGDAIASYLQTNHTKHRVHYLIWRQRNWNVERNLSPTAWRWMSDRGGATANHYDHVHVSVYS
ncbi:MAG: SH3 domain-containing protein [Micropruina sp.]|nr:SH3 domain-containing protein [Micropruina sp.]